MDSGTKTELLATVEIFMDQHGTVVFDSQQYHNIEDLKADVEAFCKSKPKQVAGKHLVS